MNLVFEDATPMSEKARICLDGLSGSGKTKTALRLARGLVGPNGLIGVVDTERGNASKYSRKHPFKRLNLTHFSPEALTAATAAAAHAGIGCLIVDTFTHFWSGQGGMLALVDAKRSTGPFGGWKDARPIEQKMMDALFGFPGHVIVTLRVKADYVLSTDENGRPKVTKVGMKPDQREGLEYEFDVAGSLDLGHVLTITKSRIDDVPEMAVGATHLLPGEDLGEVIGDWLADGEKLPTLLDYRDMVMSATSVEKLRETRAEVFHRNMQGLPLVDNGRTLALAEFIDARGMDLKRQTQLPAPTAAAVPQNTPTGPVHRPVDAAGVADYTLRIGQAPAPDHLDPIERELRDRYADQSMPEADLDYLLTVLEQRRTNLATLRKAHA
ncbi:AAA domain-containing protein [Sinosporangium album]|uniref:AAA domain-containing protein n=1 Tax=Sinosporangium album TaxID=504805 RepID=A0A1G8EH60_9ACTN|nr:AAA family ATPase [Sinosporangium album]SDH69255.1 AAA domain-containing protein [Sinosporangium album]